ncbi:hypothetical protein MLD38_033785 [Melastoma candidum]|uniref:Uncharacterized protein n=1 Tax=Melastoma candidum TaxID=119954 RepID=A0ACB9MAH9_9MYRT|nr:hypothetical protein MLD38_033785 [Melastoma candidum]
MEVRSYCGREVTRRAVTESPRLSPQPSLGYMSDTGKRGMIEKGKENEVVNKQYNPYAKPTGDKCYRCGEPGHKSNICPKRRQVNMADYEKGENEEEEEEEGVCKPDWGDENVQQTFVVRKVLLAPRQDDSQRNALFRTRCTISNHIFEVIIDNGSCENIISRSLVNTLKFPAEKHPEPYNNIWITNGEGIKVKERCRVPLLIGK